MMMRASVYYACEEGNKLYITSSSTSSKAGFALTTLRTLSSGRGDGEVVNHIIIYYYLLLLLLLFIVIIIMKSSSDRDNNYCHYVIQRMAGRLRKYTILSSGRQAHHNDVQPGS
jgi:hypothetical protein